MRILIVRHGDPNYELDTLTETGWKEAELVADYLSKEDIKAFYVSPMGRAQDTASCTLKKLNRTAKTCDWLHEFSPQIKRPDMGGDLNICWDWLPQDMAEDAANYDKDKWLTTDIMKDSNVQQEYKMVCDGLDDILKAHGYVRDGLRYVKSSDKCIANGTLAWILCSTDISYEHIYRGTSQGYCVFPCK